jgi:hypothetical protein
MANDRTPRRVSAGRVHRLAAGIAAIACLTHSSSLADPPASVTQSATAPVEANLASVIRTTPYDRDERDVDLQRLDSLPDLSLKPGYTRVGEDWLRVAQHIQSLSAANQDVLFAEHMGRKSLYTCDERITLLLAIAFEQDSHIVPAPFHSLVVRQDEMWVAPRAGTDITLASQVWTFWNLRNDAIGFAQHVRAASRIRDLAPFLAAATVTVGLPSDLPRRPPPVLDEEVRTEKSRELWMNPGTLISILKHLPPEEFVGGVYRPSAKHVAVARLLSERPPRDAEVMLALYSGARRTDGACRTRCAVLVTLIYDTELSGPADGPSLAFRLSRDEQGGPVVQRVDATGEQQLVAADRALPDPVDYLRAVSASHPVRRTGSLPTDPSLRDWADIERACRPGATSE